MAEPERQSEKEKQVYQLFVLAYGIDSFVNYVVLEGIVSTNKEQYLLPETEVHESYFYIMLLDLLKIYVPWNKNKVNLFDSVLEFKPLSSDLNITNLQSSIKLFSDWLQDKQGVPLWLPNAGHQCCLRLQRKKLIHIYANLKKHNFTNLSRVQKEILEGIKKTKLSTIDILKDLPAIEDRLQLNEMHNWMSLVVAMLIEIRKDLHEYLLPLAKSQYRLIDHPEYKWEMPAWIEDETYQFFFWDLMNLVRGGPTFKFKLKPYILKDRSCKDDIDE